jgi:tetratricopeptide (TPR) repeat protein
MTYFQLEQFEDAFLDFDASVTRDPNYAVGYFYRGRMYVVDRKWGEAEKDFTKAVELDPKLTHARSWRAIALAKTGRPGEAARDADRCAADEPDEPLTLFYAARALAQCAKAARDAGDEDAVARYAARSAGLLRRAIELGFKDSDRLVPGTDFDPVRDRPDFRELLKKLPPPKEPKKDEK